MVNRVDPPGDFDEFKARVERGETPTKDDVANMIASMEAMALGLAEADILLSEGMERLKTQSEEITYLRVRVNRQGVINTEDERLLAEFVEDVDVILSREEREAIASLSATMRAREAELKVLRATVTKLSACPGCEGPPGDRRCTRCRGER